MVGRTLAENGNTLELLANGLREAVELRDDQNTLEWAITILKWGGVTSRNSKLLQDNQEGLANFLALNAERLESPLTDAESLSIGRYNAGMTKIYVLLSFSEDDCNN